MLSGHATGSEGIGAIIVEPIQGRGGKVVPPEGFLQGLRDLCDRHELVLIFDEIYTGFGRTGDLFACNRQGVVPDILCTGKAMGGGAPMSAAVGRPEVMESWGASQGEAIHTQTFLGNPLACAMAKAAVDTIVDDDWPSRVRERGEALAGKLESLAARWPDRIADVRGRGMMWGLEVVEPGPGAEPDGNTVRRLMDFCRQSGYLFLPSGTHGNVVGLTPPFVASEQQIDGFLDAFERGLEHLTERG
jgi:4-aminobutyrate aminotransferase-like enzyme